MVVKKSKLTGLMLAFLMASGVCAYSQSDYMLVSGTTMTADERYQEMFKEVKTCFGAEDVHIIQTKNYELAKAWADKEIVNERRYAIMQPNKETGVYVAISLPNKSMGKMKGKQRKIALTERHETNSAVFEKVQTCVAAGTVYAIETKDADILEAWIKAEDESRYISTNFDAATGVYTAVSVPKTDGGGKVLFRKID